MSPNVLIYADDDPLVRATLAMALESRGLCVHQCENGLEAVDLCRRIHPEVVLLDINMPVLDGLAAARRIRADPSIAGTRLIAISGGGDHFAEGGEFDAVLCKPVTLAHLLEVVLGTS